MGSLLSSRMISIHALLAESDDSILAGVNELLISIHALLAESDSGHPDTRRFDAISIHALLAESDGFDSGTFVPAEKFLSTLSLRRATLAARDGLADLVFLSTLSLRRATSSRLVETAECRISIHALLAESDKKSAC